MNRLLGCCTAAAVLGLALGAASATTFSLDDNPAAPINSAAGVIPGFGAEDPFGLAIRLAPLAPSPSVGAPPLPPAFGDAEILSPGPVVNVSAVSLYLNALSNNTHFRGNVNLDFSVDRSSIGAGGTAVAAQTALNQQPADIFRTTRSFTAPGTFAGTLGGAGFVGPLPTAGGPGVGNNRLILDESALGLTPGLGVGGVIGPTLPAPPIAPGTHDNVDAFEWRLLDTTGDMTTDRRLYFSTNPDEALIGPVGPSAADLWTVAPGTFVPVPFAPSPALGLDQAGLNVDDVDALVMWDLATLGIMDPGIDYALFSLGPGSASLAANGLAAADVFFTDFTGAYALYADAWDLGLLRGQGGLTADNVDALEVVPEPVTLTGLLLGIGGLVNYVRRRRE